jgi:hypothetical protein
MADTTDFTDPESNVPFIIGITVGLTSLSTVLTCLRLYTRVAVLKTQGLDDAAVAVAQVGDPTWSPRAIGLVLTRLRFLPLV